MVTLPGALLSGYLLLATLVSGGRICERCRKITSDPALYKKPCECGGDWVPQQILVTYHPPANMPKRLYGRGGFGLPKQQGTFDVLKYHSAIGCPGRWINHNINGERTHIFPDLNIDLSVAMKCTECGWQGPQRTKKLIPFHMASYNYCPNCDSPKPVAQADFLALRFYYQCQAGQTIQFLTHSGSELPINTGPQEWKFSWNTYGSTDIKCPECPRVQRLSGGHGHCQACNGSGRVIFKLSLDDPDVLDQDRDAEVALCRRLEQLGCPPTEICGFLAEDCPELQAKHAKAKLEAKARLEAAMARSQMGFVMGFFDDLSSGKLTFPCWPW